MGTLRAALAGPAPVVGVLAVLVLAAAGVLYLLLPELQLAAQALAGLGLVLLLVFVVGAYDLVKTALLGRQARYGTNTLVMTVAFIGIAGLANFLGAHYHQRLDTTASGQYTLSQHTRAVLKGLQGQVHVVGFFVKRDPIAVASQEQAENLLREYAFYTDKISYEFVDPEEKPAIAKQYEIRDFGALVFTYEGRKHQTFGLQEQDFTGAILNVTGVEQKRVYFLAGHGEADIESAEETGLQLARDGLQADNYRIEKLDLTVTPAVPENAAVLVVAGPKKPLQPSELRAIETYLTQGGKAMFLLDPDPPQELQQLLGKWGLIFREGTVIDTVTYAQPDVRTPAVQRDQYLLTQITKDLDTTFFPGATGIFVDLPEPDREYLAITPLAHTSFQSWQTVAARTEGVPNFSEGDTFGPLVLAVQVEATAPRGGKPLVPSTRDGPKATRLIVVGDTDFATNKYFYSLYNSDLFLNSVNWLGAQEELISIRPKPPEFRRLIITQRGWDWIVYSSIVFLPAVVLLAGGVVWWQRR
ncbi:MAG: GldG family protein [Chloroflexi bacterium]|nr:GldG family protein [Chloroflexota bacterium]